MKCPFCGKEIESGFKNFERYGTFERVCDDCDNRIVNAITNEIKRIKEDSNMK